MSLPQEVFSTVVANAPLVSIDLIVQRADGAVLLGERRNRPAKDFWFVPGGRIFKDERMAAAFERILRRELGVHVPASGWEFAGVYEHLYPDSFIGGDSVSTHYVVLAYRLSLPDQDVVIEGDEQHERFEWVPVEALLTRPDVHANTKAYFR